MKFNKINHEFKNDYKIWICGIYKIISYESGKFFAYYIPENYKNWGNLVCDPPDYQNGRKFWKTLGSAKKYCEEHAKTHNPSKKTLITADKCLNKLLVSPA